MIVNISIKFNDASVFVVATAMLAVLAPNMGAATVKFPMKYSLGSVVKNEKRESNQK